ncbi:phosphatase [Bacillus sp. KH172YL63]|uniref:phosphatase n=1 Tax=Bacillus sp. KH172YL63 TaxID=2709784 RepID=UPI0013E481C1|nr:phosphatase [Bacillus sp. KH172YL63]BCB04169.1 hypothetical protein KH172YL63_23020 [Bacillus sp. KH172YL63]
MKSMILGLSSLFIASILYGATLIAAAVYSGWLVEEGGLGWDSRYGVFGTAIREVGMMPLILTGILTVSGGYLLWVSAKGSTVKQ